MLFRQRFHSRSVNHGPRSSFSDWVALDRRQHFSHTSCQTSCRLRCPETRDNFDLSRYFGTGAAESSSVLEVVQEFQEPRLVGWHWQRAISPPRASYHYLSSTPFHHKFLPSLFLFPPPSAPHQLFQLEPTRHRQTSVHCLINSLTSIKALITYSICNSSRIVFPFVLHVAQTRANFATARSSAPLFFSSLFHNHLQGFLSFRARRLINSI